MWASCSPKSRRRLCRFRCRECRCARCATRSVRRGRAIARIRASISLRRAARRCCRPRAALSRASAKTAWAAPSCGCLGPGGDRHYYAHLNSVADIKIGQRVAPGDVLGTVGTTGNARGTPPHLHYGVYRRGEGAINPFPLLVNRLAERQVACAQTTLPQRIGAPSDAVAPATCCAPPLSRVPVPWLGRAPRAGSVRNGA